MSSLSNTVSQWLLPPALKETLKDIYQFSQSVVDPLIRSNFYLKNRFDGQRCFILATGPSIKQEDLSRLVGEKCISVNNFFVHPLFAQLRPIFHCIAPWHSPITEEQFFHWMKGLASSDPTTELAFGRTDYKRTAGCGLFTEHKLHFLQFGGNQKRLVKHGVDLSRALPQPNSVTIMATYLAIYLGFKKIYLLGCDHDWILHVGESKHFYNENEHAFRQHQFTDKDDWGDVAIEAQACANLFNQYKTLREVATQSGILIANATKSSLLDVFERVSLDKILSEKTKERNIYEPTNCNC